MSRYNLHHTVLLYLLYKLFTESITALLSFIRIFNNLTFVHLCFVVVLVYGSIRCHCCFLVVLFLWYTYTVLKCCFICAYLPLWAGSFMILGTKNVVGFVSFLDFFNVRIWLNYIYFWAACCQFFLILYFVLWNLDFLFVLLGVFCPCLLYDTSYLIWVFLVLAQIIIIDFVSNFCSGVYNFFN